ncbi:MAG: hypothetical protein ACXVJN_17845, partial [Mucilaginibacter sp.]
PTANSWNVVPRRRMVQANVNDYIVRTNAEVINRVTVINNVTNNYYGNNRGDRREGDKNWANYNRGPQMHDVENATNTRINPVKVRDNVRPGAQLVSNNQLLVYRPAIQQNTQNNSQTAPRRVQPFRGGNDMIKIPREYTRPVNSDQRQNDQQQQRRNDPQQNPQNPNPRPNNPQQNPQSVRPDASQNPGQNPNQRPNNPQQNPQNVRPDANQNPAQNPNSRPNNPQQNPQNVRPDANQNPGQNPNPRPNNPQRNPQNVRPDANQNPGQNPNPRPNNPQQNPQNVRPDANQSPGQNPNPKPNNPQQNPQNVRPDANQNPNQQPNNQPQNNNPRLNIIPQTKKDTTKKGRKPASIKQVKQ